MPVSQHGEIGVLVKPDEPNRLVIHWRVTKKGKANRDMESWGFIKGGLVYYTSMGWVAGLPDGSDYFESTKRERSLKPCIDRALDYAQKKWPGWRNETH